MTTPEDTEPSKLCRKCLLVKAKTEFYPMRDRDGYVSFCKPCAKERANEYYLNSKNRRKSYFDKYKQSDKGKATAKKSSSAAYYRYPEKAIARSRLRYAVSKGIINKEPCMDCGVEKVEAHHYIGYEEKNWYDVYWLCRKHHRDIHKFSLESRVLI